MKTLKLRETSLMQSSARYDFGTELKAVKISFEEMMAFEKLSSFDEMLYKYGRANRLQPGEEYVGYLAVYYASWLQLIVWMDGSLRKATYRDVCGTLESYILEAQKEGRYWSLDHRKTSDGSPIYGDIRKMVNFQQCTFGRHVESLQRIPDKDYLQGVDPEAMSRGLKKKILDGAIARAPFELTEDEYFVLKTYMGESDLQHYFLVKEA